MKAESKNKFENNRRIVESILQKNIKSRASYQNFLDEFIKEYKFETATDFINSGFHLVSGLRNFQYIQNKEGRFLPKKAVMTARRKKSFEYKEQYKK